MIRNVKLENFGPHKNFEHEFKPGVNLVLGDNGSGKSNVVYAIGWAVFGPKGLPAEYSQSDVIHDGQKFCSVEVDLDLLGASHTFYRRYDGKNIQVSVTRDGEEVATGSKGVEDFLASYGVNWQAASVLFSRQRELDAFVYETPARRKEIFESLLRVEVINEARKEARKKVADYSSEPEILSKYKEEKVQEEIDTHTKSVQKYSSILEKCADEEVAITIHRKKALEAITAASSEGESKNLQAKVRALNSEMTTMHRRLDLVEPSITSAPVLSDVEVKEYRENIKRAEANLTANRKALKLYLEAEKNLRDQCNIALGKLESLNETLERLAKGQCPTCGSKIEDPEEHARLVHDISADDLRAESLRLAGQLEVTSTECKNVQLYIEADEAVRIALSTELTQFEYAVSLVPEAKEINGGIRAKKTLIKDLEEKISSLSGPTDAQKKEFELADKNLNDFRENFDECKKNLRRANDSLDLWLQLQKEYLEAKAEYAEAESNRKLFVTVGKALDEFRNQVLRAALEWVSLRATQVVRMIGTLPESGPNVELKLDKDLQFWFDTGEKKVPVYRFSGGQKAVFAICLRMALSEYFSDRLGLKGFLLLDAVLDSLTPENQDATAVALHASGPQQAIIFSHFDPEALDAERIQL